MRQREHLVHMANQIARNFAVMGDVDAAAATADHIAMFWAPTMKQALLDDLAGLDAIAAQAIGIIAADPRPDHQTPATDFGSDDGIEHADAG